MVQQPNPVDRRPRRQRPATLPRSGPVNPQASPSSSRSSIRNCRGIPRNIALCGRSTGVSAFKTCHCSACEGGRFRAGGGHANGNRDIARRREKNVLKTVRQIGDGRGFVLLRRLRAEDYWKDDLGLIFAGDRHASRTRSVAKRHGRPARARQGFQPGGPGGARLPQQQELSAAHGFVATRSACCACATRSRAGVCHG